MYSVSAFADEAGSTIEQQITTLLENDIKYIEPRSIDGKSILEFDEHQISDFKTKLDKNDIKVSALGSPIGKIKTGDDFDEHIKKFEHAVKICKTLDTSRMRIFSFFTNNKDDFNIVTYRLGRLIEIAQKHDLVLCHENEKDIYGDTAEFCNQLYDFFGGSLKLIFDPANFIQCGQDTLSAYSLLKDKIDYFHIKDALIDGTVVPAGHGAGNIQTILQNFNKPTFLTLEPHLKTFDGYSTLSDDTSIKETIYSSNSEAFSVATNALKEILGGIAK